MYLSNVVSSGLLLSSIDICFMCLVLPTFASIENLGMPFPETTDYFKGSNISMKNQSQQIMIRCGWNEKKQIKRFNPAHVRTSVIIRDHQHLGFVFHRSFWLWLSDPPTPPEPNIYRAVALFVQMKVNNKHDWYWRRCIELFIFSLNTLIYSLI